jgi:hypothetical protein
MEKSTIKEKVSSNFLYTLDELVGARKIKNLTEFINSAGSVKSTLSRIKNNEGYVTLDLLYSAVNDFNVNANHIFVKDGLKNEELLRQNINSPTIHGNNNHVIGQNGKLNIHSNSGSIENITVAEKIINQIPDKKARAELNKHLESVKGEIADLKKMLEHYKQQLADKDKVIATKDELIETQKLVIQMQNSSKKKKN